jgi:hypothetical protein
MSRSRHTDPAALRASRRALDPRASRGQGDERDSRRLRRVLKEHGYVLDGGGPTGNATSAQAMPRIGASKPGQNKYHPASPADIREVLSVAGLVATYGLQEVELFDPPLAATSMHLGALVAPGHIRLYAQPRDRVVLGGLAATERAWLEAGGAKVEVFADGVQTRVLWPHDGLRRFMMLWVLPHEIGHHLIQHHRGKRVARVLRTLDHELTAELFAARFRDEWNQAHHG